jgi:DNA replication protein DnaC
MSHYAKMFDAIGYKREGIEHFDRILDFMAKYHLASGQMLNSAEAVAMYESELKDKKFTMPKGLILRGAPGTGKTLAARVIATRFGLPMWETHQIRLRYLKAEGDDWLYDFIYNNKKCVIVIDDLGAEGELKKYGNESPMGLVFTMRAKFWESYGTSTIYTTNFLKTKEMIETCYNTNVRLLDRLTAYQEPVEFTGASKRQ